MELLALVLTSPLHASAASIKVGNVTDSTACHRICLSVAVSSRKYWDGGVGVRCILREPPCWVG